jgi:uncharacterized alkaline shock family protein YloU
VHLFFGPKVYVVTNFGAWTYQTHVANKYIDKLWQFVQLEFADKVTRKFLGRDNIARGISISKEEEGLGIDIYLNVEFGAKIPDLAWEVQSSVKEAVESVTGLKVQMVNIHVEGVNLPKNVPQED